MINLIYKEIKRENLGLLPVVSCAAGIVETPSVISYHTQVGAKEYFFKVCKSWER